MHTEPYGAGLGVTLEASLRPGVPVSQGSCYGCTHTLSCVEPGKGLKLEWMVCGLKLNQVLCPTKYSAKTHLGMGWIRERLCMTWWHWSHYGEWLTGILEMVCLVGRWERQSCLWVGGMVLSLGRGAWSYLWIGGNGPGAWFCLGLGGYSALSG